MAGGHKGEGKGYFVQPTVLVDTNENMKVVQEEIFGPVVTAMPFSDPEEILPQRQQQRLRTRRRRLDTGHQQSSPHRRKACAPEPSGSIATTSSTPPMPFGGYKQSGWGREMGHDALSLYTQTKAVCTRLG